MPRGLAEREDEIDRTGRAVVHVSASVAGERELQRELQKAFSANRQAEADLGMQVVLGNASQQVIELVLSETRRYRRNASGFPVGDKRYFRFFYRYKHAKFRYCHCHATDARPRRHCRGANTVKAPSTLNFICKSLRSSLPYRDAPAVAVLPIGISIPRRAISTIRNVRRVT